MENVRREEIIKAKLADFFVGDSIEVIDYAGDQDHFTIKIKSTKFEGLRTLDKQKMVFKALGDLVGKIHAMQFELST